MMNFKNVFKRADQKVKGLYGINFMSGKIAVSDASGIFYEVDEKTGELTDVTNFVKELSGDAIGIPVDISTIQIGDVIEYNEGLGIIVKTNPLKVFSEDRVLEEVVQVKSILEMGNFIIKYIHPLASALGSGGQNQNMFGNLNTNAEGGINPMLMMMMFKDEGNKGTDSSMMETLFLSQIMGNNLLQGDNQMMPMMPMMLMAFMGEDSDDSLIEMMLMSQMMGLAPKTIEK